MGLDIYVCKLKRASKKDIKTYNYFRLIDDNGNKDSLGFPEFTHKYITKITEEWYDWDKYKEQTGINIDDYDFCSSLNSKEKGCITEFENKITKEILEIKDNDIPIYNKEVSIIGYEEIGYQRKGLNNQFYKDIEKGIINEFVWTKEELYKYKDLYCLEKGYFQHQIIDTFIEGECCVYFSW